MSIIVAILLVPFMILAAFVVDFGMAFAQARAFSTSADSAALAIVAAKRTSINASPNTPVTCKNIKDADAALPANDPNKALKIAKDQTDRNGPFAVNTASGVGVTVTLECLAADGVTVQDDGFLKATVDVQRAVPTTLGKMVGVNTVNAQRNGAAALGVAKKVSGIFPLAMCDQQADEIAAHATADFAAGLPYRNEVISTSKQWNPNCQGQAGGGSGNWGWLNCASLGSPGGVSVSDLASYITEGCNVDLTLTGSPPSSAIGGAPGNKINANGVISSLTSQLGKTFAFPVFDRITGNGAGVSYRIVAFIQLKLISFEENSGDITVQYVNYAPVADLSQLCGIGNINCNVYNAYAIGLIK
ncbi:Tad domain-containing protein [Oryzobacter telluris]|uniref:Tad domain-containing protein n=1 Tax=Oryzobacter telluris TaxID=3149179 RepID=UPI00370DA220